MASGTHRGRRNSLLITGLILLLVGQSLSPLALTPAEEVAPVAGRDVDPWTGGGIEWPQFGRTPGRESIAPAHAPNDPDAGELLSITDPVLNWRHFDEGDVGVEALGVPVGNFSANIDTGGLTLDSCARDSLSPVFIYQETVQGDAHAFLRIVDGDSSDPMWQVDVGVIDLEVKAAPLLVDIDEDGRLEILIVYDTNGHVTVEFWSPDIECDVTGWKPGGSHETERLWRWSHSTFELAADRTCSTCHRPVAQPLLADLFLDGTPELVLALIDDVNDEPNMLALSLPTTGTPSPIWEVTLDDGTHPSDPAWAQIDAVTSAIVLTTIDENDGDMWIWRLNGANGQIQYSDSLQNFDGDTYAPHVRLPGPIITQLDGDAAPEMVITIPTDVDAAGTGDGAEFRGLEVNDASEIFSFSASNGYADAPPVLLDSDDNGITDRICWNTWYRDTWSWHGMVGCHDYNEASQNVLLDWNQGIEGTSGNPNDEIAVSAPTAMDIDGTGHDEILVTFGRTLYAHDGESGSRSSINAEWVNGLELPHRTWAGHALADLDNDGALDLLVGDMMISQAGADVRPFEDGRAITFNPSTPDPGELVTVTGYFENAGTASTEVDTFARMYVDGDLVETHREGVLDPVSPTGDGNFASFSFEWSGGLGEHLFELRLDEHGNVTQTRTDNDQMAVLLTIIAPYNVSVGVPTDPVRVLPGGQLDVQPTITSTGRLAGAWTMSIDDAGLPDNWTIEDLDPVGSGGVQIEVGASWIPTLRLSAPSQALGTDAGFVTITMTLDSDANVSQTAILAIEAERTRGLSVRGADGTGVADGVGIPGDAAAAWILVENLGNAPETISLQWNSTDWGTALTLHDSTGTEVNPLSLAPAEIRELTARLTVPQGTTLGASVSTQLTMCIGAGEDEDCRSIDLTFSANAVQVLPPHIRSVPANDRVWNAEIQLPAGVSALEWDMAAAGMIMSGWSWTTTGDLSMDGTTLRASGNAGARLSGSLSLNMPFAAPPMLHEWRSDEANHTGYTLSLSLQVMQIHRATTEITSPVTSPHRMDVDSPDTVMLLLSNPGNGPDVYDISWTLVPNANFSDDPGLTVEIPSSQYVLGAGELRSIPITLTLPQEMPAAVGLLLSFEMRSTGDIGIASTATLLVEARQDHRWEMQLLYGENTLQSGDTIIADPDEMLDLSLLVTNVGNLGDHITLTPSITVQTAGDDTGLGWTAWGAHAHVVPVNVSELLSIGVNVSEDAWKDSVATISFDGISDDVQIPPFILYVQTAHVPGWWVLAGGADLDIDRNGANVSLVVEQRGNSPALPFINGWVDVGGWTINVSSGLPGLDPGERANFTVEIIPPEGAISGHAVELTLRSKNGDGSGVGQTTLPLRVAAWHDYQLTTSEDWAISSTGGLPLAMLSNEGNAPTSIAVEILGLPEGWTSVGPSQVSLGVGESAGVPISAIPPTEGAVYGSSVTLRTLDEAGTQREATLTLVQSERAWSSSPVLFGTSGDSLELQFHPGFEVQIVAQGSDVLEQTDDGGYLWTVPPMDADGSLNVDSVDLSYWARVQDPPSRIGTCSVNPLGSEPGAVCSLLNGSDAIDWTAILRTADGQVIDHLSGHLSANTSRSGINLSSSTWNPSPGEHVLRVTLLDGHGGVIADAQRTVMVRDTAWNLAVTAVELRTDRGQQNIVISVARVNHSKLTDAVCDLTLSAGDWSATHRMSVAGDLAPQVVIHRPNLPDGTTVNVELGCEAPWDQDADSTDDSGMIILSDGIAPPVEGLDFAMLIGGIVVIFGVMGLLGFIRPNAGQRKTAAKQPKSAPAQTSMSRHKKPEMDDSIAIEGEDDSPRPEAAQDLEEEDDEVEVVEEKPVSLDDFEARLERLRSRRDGLGGR